MPFWGGSGSCYFVIDLPDASNKLIFNTIFSAYYFLKVHLHHFSQIKSQKESQNRKNQGFSYYFCMMIEGSGSGAGSIPMTSGSGSGSRRPKNMWIRWIRIRNTAINSIKHQVKTTFRVGRLYTQIFGPCTYRWERWSWPLKIPTWLTVSPVYKFY